MSEAIPYKDRWKQNLFYGGMLTDAALDTEAGHSIATQLAHWLNGPNTSVYDKAIDSVYLQTHVGGASLHHLIDGQHNILGAFKAAAGAMPDDALWQEVTGMAHHLGKDMFSVGGLPLFSLEPQTYHAASGWLHDTLHLPKAWLGDLMQVNGLELFAGLLSAAAVIVGYQKADIGRLSELAGASGLAAMLSANPIAMASAAVALVLAWKGRESAVDIGKGMLIGTGSAVSVQAVGAGLGVLGLGGGLLPALGCVAVSAAVSLYVRNLLSTHLHHEQPEPNPAPVDSLWQLPDVQAAIDAKRAMFSFPIDISPDVTAEMGRRLDCLR